MTITCISKESVDIMTSLIQNQPLVAGFAAWLAAQLIKFFLALRHGFSVKVLKQIYATGGFPSSHTATVTALATSCGLNFGFASPFFAIAAVFALVVIYDAFTLRAEAGKHAEILNQMMEDFYKYKRIEMKQLKELLGHTRFEVFFGFLLGIIVAYLIYSTGTPL